MVNKDIEIILEKIKSKKKKKKKNYINILNIYIYLYIFYLFINCTFLYILYIYLLNLKLKMNKKTYLKKNKKVHSFTINQTYDYVFEFLKYHRWKLYPKKESYTDPFSKVYV